MSESEWLIRFFFWDSRIVVRVRALRHTVFVRECVRARVYERVCVSFFWGGVVESWCTACALWHTVAVKENECVCVRVCYRVYERECVTECV